MKIWLVDYIITPIIDYIVIPLINLISKVLLTTLDLTKRATIYLYEQTRKACEYLLYLVSEILYFIKIQTIKIIDNIKRLTFYLQGKIIDASIWLRMVIYQIYCSVVETI